MKKPYSVSLDSELIQKLKRFEFVNWSKVVNKYLTEYCKAYKTELRGAHNHILIIEHNEKNVQLLEDSTQ